MNFTSQRRWRVLISAVRAASKFRWWADANLNLPVKPAMDDYRAVKALGFENIKEVDDKLHWADILATKVVLIQAHLTQETLLFQFLSCVYNLEHIKCLIGVGLVSMSVEVSCKA